ncbi:cell division protein SepF [Fusobacterium nucleatum]|uniref:cell division protein SepF n=1 Tax=Fusobacterium nucleatum TaxID=851 RepID=UPI003CFD7EBE
MADNIDIVFLKPAKFEDCVICADYIKEDKIVNMNLSQLDDNDSRRVLDYIAGAIFITKADIVNVGNKIFCSIPSNKSYLNEMNKENSPEEEVEIVKR